MQVGGDRRKLTWLWVLLTILGLLVLIGAGVFAYTSSQSKVGSNTTNKPDESLTLSSNIGGQMDASTDVTSTFTQAVDFSKATPKDTSLSVFFSKPTDLKETWAVNKASDISLEATQSEVTSKRIFIKSDNSTYIYSNDTKTWVKTDGSQLSPTSIFYPAEPRGSLFYVSRIKSLTDMEAEKLDGKSFQKVKIVLTKDVLSELLSSVNTAFAENKYQDIKADNLEVLAYIDDANNVQKVSVSGSVEVNSDMYAGKVSINASGDYKYVEQKVVKP